MSLTLIGFFWSLPCGCTFIKGSPINITIPFLVILQLTQSTYRDHTSHSQIQVQFQSKCLHERRGYINRCGSLFELHDSRDVGLNFKELLHILERGVLHKEVSYQARFYVLILYELSSWTIICVTMWCELVAMC